jgi:hypothetical protein
MGAFAVQHPVYLQEGLGIKSPADLHVLLRLAKEQCPF